MLIAMYLRGLKDPLVKEATELSGAICIIDEIGKNRIEKVVILDLENEIPSTDDVYKTYISNHIRSKCT